jgi:serine/threonine-protein kinase
MSLAPGSRLGPYEIGAPIGAGGMGEVYKARDTRLDRSVAIKVLPPEFSADSDRRARFEREAKTIAGLNHPNICTLHDVGEHPSTSSRQAALYLVMELLTGETLAERLAKGALPLDEALSVAAEVADALAAAHRQGVVHRDLKPGNVMLTKSGAKLLDFGLAKLTGHGEQPAAESVASAPTQTRPLTTQGAIVGTLQYMAPEQVEGKPADARTDLWALGAILYELLTGKRAFTGASAASLIGNIMNSQPPALATLMPLTPPALNRLVRRCLSKDPDARWQHAADVAEELRGIQTDSATVPLTRIAPSRRRRKWTLAPGFGLVVLVAAALAWVGIGISFKRSDGPSHFTLVMPGRTALTRISSGVIAVAPDASGVVYLGTAGRDDSQLFWHDLRGQVSSALIGTEGASNPFLAPDGHWLGFFQNGKILKLPLQAGQVPEGSPASLVATVDAVRGATWGPDGTIVYGALSGGLWGVSANGGQPRPLTTPDAAKNEVGHYWPSVLPGGRQILFTILDASSRWDRSSIAVLSLDTLLVTKVLSGGAHARYLPSGHIVFARDGTLLAVPFDVKTLEKTGNPMPVLNDVCSWPGSNAAAFDVARDGALVYGSERREPPNNALLWVGRDGDDDLAVPDRQPYSPQSTVSTDGQRLAVAIDGTPYQSIAICDLRDKRWQRLNIKADCASPLLSPAGDRLVFLSNLDGPWTLYVRRVDGDSPPVRLTRPEMALWPWSWSRDGIIAYQVQTATTLNTYVVPATGQSEPTRWGPEGAVAPSFSPDGRWIAYQSNESGKPDVWVRPFPGPGERQAVSGRDGGYGPLWSGDEIFYVERLRDTRIMSRRVESLSPLRFGPPRLAFALPFVLDSKVFFPRPYAVVPDGRRLLVVQPDDRAPSTITALQVIRNWPEEVKAKLSAR